MVYEIRKQRVLPFNRSRCDVIKLLSWSIILLSLCKPVYLEAYTLLVHVSKPKDLVCSNLDGFCPYTSR